jgi:hypothetical protein
MALATRDDGLYAGRAGTAIVAAMRCFVALRLGREIEVPDIVAQASREPRAGVLQHVAPAVTPDAILANAA